MTNTLSIKAACNKTAKGTTFILEIYLQYTIYVVNVQYFT